MDYQQYIDKITDILDKIEEEDNIETILGHVSDAKSAIDDLEMEVGEMYDEIEGLKKQLEELEYEQESFTPTHYLQGNDEIEVRKNGNLQDDSFLDFLGDVLESGFTTLQVETSLRELYGNKIKV